MARDLYDEKLKFIHQLDKYDELDDTRKDIFPISLIQAIFDKSGVRLDVLLSQFNVLYLPFKGNVEETRLQVLPLYRRNGILLTYIDYDNKVHYEIYEGDQKEDIVWKDSKNWKQFSIYIKEQINDIFKNIDDYPDIKEELTNIIINYFNEEVRDDIENLVTNNVNQYLSKYDFTNIITTLFNNYVTTEQFINDINNSVTNYLNTNITNLVNEYLDINSQTLINNYLNEHISNLINEYFKSDNGNTHLTEITNSLLDDKIGLYLENINKTIQDHERVIANALARHEIAITEIQNQLNS